MRCTYCGNDYKKLSREHVISRTVLETAFGKSNTNIARSELWGNKPLKDHEHIVKDVCAECNNKLSSIDLAGSDFVKKVLGFCDSTNKKLKITKEALFWIVKTHLNFLRVIPDVETKSCYKLDSQIYKSLMCRDASVFKFLTLCVEGWEGKKYFWDRNDPRKIPIFSYKSVRFPFYNMVVSDLVIKSVDTIVFVPFETDYSNFGERVSKVIDIMIHDYGFNPQTVDPHEVLRSGELSIKNIRSHQSLLGIMKKIG